MKMRCQITQRSLIACILCIRMGIAFQLWSGIHLTYRSNTQVVSKDCLEACQSIAGGMGRRRNAPYDYRHVLAASLGEEEGKDDVPSIEERAEVTLRRLSRAELEVVAKKLSLPSDAETDDIVHQAVVILVEKMSQRDARQIRGGEAPARTPPKAGVEGGREVTFEDGDRPRRSRREREPEPPLSPGEIEYFASCPRGLETVLKQELLSPLIRATYARTSGGGCRFRGNQAVGYRAVLWVRTAHRVMELVGEGGSSSPEDYSAPIDSPEALYDVAAGVEWDKYMRSDQTLSVDAVVGVVPLGLTHTHFTALTVKNAVVDQFREVGQRPSVETEQPDLPIVVYLDRGRVLIYSRCLSGSRSMHKRGYRDAMHVASLKENIAAGLLLASKWDPETQTLADPMCGSGTLVIEAALIAMRRAPGLVAMGRFSDITGGGAGGGRHGGRGGGTSGWMPIVSSWPDFDEEAWERAVDEAMSEARSTPPLRILANDWHEGALSLAYVRICDGG
ncbi:unnamed protein product [Choristocarpus tenellus]